MLQSNWDSPIGGIGGARVKADSGCQTTEVDEWCGSLGWRGLELRKATRVKERTQLEAVQQGPERWTSRSAAE